MKTPVWQWYLLASLLLLASVAFTLHAKQTLQTPCRPFPEVCQPHTQPPLCQPMLCPDADMREHARKLTTERR